MPADRPGIFWPRKIRGIWEFPIPYVYSPPLKARQTALDYNFWYTYNGAQDRPKDARKIRRIVRQTYEYMYQRAFDGNRAPLVIANHFNDWNNNAFNPATWDFMRKVCGNPETICATYQDVIAWMELQDPEVIAGFQKLGPVAPRACRPGGNVGVRVPAGLQRRVPHHTASVRPRSAYPKSQVVARLDRADDDRDQCGRRILQLQSLREHLQTAGGCSPSAYRAENR